MKNRVFAAMLMFVIFISFTSSGCSEANPVVMNPGAFSLKQAEREYLEKLRKTPIRLAYSYDVIAKETADGRFYGMYEPVIHMLENVFGLTVELVKQDWEKAAEDLETGEVDIYGMVTPVSKRWQKYYSTAPFFKAYAQIISRIEEPLGTMGELKGKAIGVLANSVINNTMENYVSTGGKVIYYPSIAAMFDALERGEISCAATVGNVETELLLRPSLLNEFTIDNLYTEQGLISARNDILPLLRLIDRYIAADPSFRERVMDSRREVLLESVRERFADDIAYLNENVETVRVYSSGMLYPLCYLEDGVYKGMQVEINDIFTALTGVPIALGIEARTKDGLNSAERIRSGEYTASGATYFDARIEADPDFKYSIPLWTDVIRSYSYDSVLKGGRNLTVASTDRAASYIDWPMLVDNTPLLVNSRRDVFDALKDRRTDVAFMSEMCFNYIWLMEKNYLLQEIDFVTAVADMHLLYGSENVQFNRMYDEAIRLYRAIYPMKTTEWKIQSENYKINDLRMRRTQQNTIIVVGIVFSILFVLLIYLLDKYTTYDKQISQLIRTQQTFDLAWGDIKKNTFLSKGNLPFFRAWGLKLEDKSKCTMQELSDAFGWDLVEDYRRDMEEMGRQNLAFIVNERSIISPMDNQPRYYRRFLHKLSANEFMACLQDITSDVSKEKELVQIASTDSLSKLLTRRAMNDKIVEKCEELKVTGGHAFIIMMDLDDFKDINDTYGHNIGDKVLVAVSGIIQATEGCENSTSRWGGEEFLIMMECDCIETAEERARSIIERVECTDVLFGGNKSIRVTISGGLARLDPFNDYTLSVARADEALYRAKRAGKNCLRIV